MTEGIAEKRYCIIGAGASGLPVAKSLAERNIAFDCFEALGDVGGIWNPESPHRVYGSTYLNSSQKLSRYTDFNFAEGLPHYLSAAQAQEYLRAYARHFGLYDKISFNSEVARAERVDGRWQVTLKGESEPRIYDGLVVANGHHWSPKMPSYPGTFDGEILHSHDVKSKEQLRGKRVVVVGAGNSAVDILSDAALDGAAAIHSMRRSYYFFPKMVFGRPTDRFIDLTSRWPLPRSFMRWLYKTGMLVLVGSHKAYGLPAPDHGLFEQHPTACTTYLDHVVHGRVRVHPGIVRLDGKTVHFTDGSAEAADLIVLATGYDLSFPFLDSSYILDAEGRSKLFIHTFHRELDDFFVAGLFEPAEGGVWQLADYQAKLIGSFLVALARDSEKADWFRKLKRDGHPDIGHGIAYQGTAWHKFEIQHYRFRKYMKGLLERFGRASEETVDGAPLPDEKAQQEAA
ncbi:NAD(P)-binding domain-containing protein [Methyloligella sp. 2.7D]|uniref:flavin-containing monooxygenase n=1 Tax=unclassified Methyloligella TaxID=2625955 RepID=UPI00157D19A3|nr:NAD(P)-binding domain-containing protein [Methyloligella sp. GL2]QKP76848.1 NAD(P)-binding domain-containing protein [Methyloligella sp. GL2]